MRNLAFIISLIFLLGSCGDPDCEHVVDVSDETVNYKIHRIEDKLVHFKNPQEIRQFFDEYEFFTGKFLKNNIKSKDSALLQTLLKLARDPHIDTLYGECQRTYGDFKDIQQAFDDAFKHVKHYYPGFTAPDIYTFISGFGGFDVFTADSIMVLGLEYFLGPEASYRPRLPTYMLRRYQKPYMVPMAMLALSNKFNETNMKDQTLLADMVYFGKAYYFVDRVRPCAHDSLIIGYTGKQLRDTEAHEHVIWSHFIDNNLLYVKSRQTKKRYIGESPNTPQIGNKCPGRIGRWVGWQIVKQYMDKNPDVTLAELMQMTDAKKILTQSKYRPKAQ